MTTVLDNELDVPQTPNGRDPNLAHFEPLDTPGIALCGFHFHDGSSIVAEVDDCDMCVVCLAEMERVGAEVVT